MHRAAAKDMARPLDPKAERIKARKERRGLRAVTRESGFAAAATLFLTTRAADFAPLVEECEACQKLQRPPRARFLGYDPATNRAYAQIIEQDGGHTPAGPPAAPGAQHADQGSSTQPGVSR